MAEMEKPGRALIVMGPPRAGGGLLAAILTLLGAAPGEGASAEAPLVLLRSPEPARDLRPLVLQVHRGPAEVAALLAAEGREPEAALALWAREVLRAEAAGRALPRRLLRCEDLLADWRACLDEVARALDAPWPRPLAEAAPEIDSLIEMARHRLRLPAVGAAGDLAGDPAPLPALPARIEALMTQLAAVGGEAGGGEAGGGEAGLAPELDRLAEALEAALPLIAPLAARSGARALRIAELEAGAAQAACEAAQDAAERAALTARAGQLDRQLHLAQVQLRALTRQHMTELTARLRLAVPLDDPAAVWADIQTLTAKVEAAGAELEAERLRLSEQRQRLIERRARVTAERARLRLRETELRQSTSWRITRPLRILSRALRRLRTRLRR